VIGSAGEGAVPVTLEIGLVDTYLEYLFVADFCSEWMLKYMEWVGTQLLLQLEIQQSRS